MYIFNTQERPNTELYTVTLWEQLISLASHSIFASGIFFVVENKQTEVFQPMSRGNCPLLIQFLSLFKSNHNDDNNPIELT